MSCKKGMRGCRNDCRHYSLVSDYRVARHSDLLREENATSGGKEEIRVRREEEDIKPITFKEWLIGNERPEEG